MSSQPFLLKASLSSERQPSYLEGNHVIKKMVPMEHLNLGAMPYGKEVRSRAITCRPLKAKALYLRSCLECKRRASLSRLFLFISSQPTLTHFTTNPLYSILINSTRPFVTPITHHGRTHSSTRCRCSNPEARRSRHASHGRPAGSTAPTTTTIATNGTRRYRGAQHAALQPVQP